MVRILRILSVREHHQFLWISPSERHPVIADGRVLSGVVLLFLFQCKQILFYPYTLLLTTGIYLIGT